MKTVIVPSPIWRAIRKRESENNSIIRKYNMGLISPKRFIAYFMEEKGLDIPRITKCHTITPGP